MKWLSALRLYRQSIKKLISSAHSDLIKVQYIYIQDKILLIVDKISPFCLRISFKDVFPISPEQVFKFQKDSQQHGRPE